MLLEENPFFNKEILLHVPEFENGNQSTHTNMQAHQTHTHARTHEVDRLSRNPERLVIAGGQMLEGVHLRA